jgi:hypothetical protein
MNWTVKKKSKFYRFNSKRRIISLMHSSILRRIWLNFMALYLGFIGSFTFFSGFPTFRLEHHWRDLISRNAHLVHQNWYRISFTFYILLLQLPRHWNAWLTRTLQGDFTLGRRPSPARAMYVRDGTANRLMSTAMVNLVTKVTTAETRMAKAPLGVTQWIRMFVGPTVMSLIVDLKTSKNCL